MKLYHLSDLHIGTVSRPGADEHKAEVMRHLSGVLDAARKEGVRFVVFAGDVFDSNAVPTSFVMEFLELLAGFSDIKFLIIPGGGGFHEDEISGHDAYTSDSLYKRIDVTAFIKSASNIFLLTPDEPRVKIDDVGFYAGFFDYPEAELFKDAVYHVAVLHGAFGEFKERGEKPLDSILDRYHYIALGHYHRFKRIAENAVYSGAFVQFEFLPYTDNATSGYVAVELGEGKPRIEYRELDGAPRFVRFEVKEEKDLERIRELLEDGAYVRVVFYFEDYKGAIEGLKGNYGRQLEISEGAEVIREGFGFLDALDEVIGKLVPEELRGDVKEFLLYGLQVSFEKSDVERFLRDRFGF